MSDETSPRCGRPMRVYNGQQGICGRPAAHQRRHVSAKTLQRLHDPEYRAAHVRTHGYGGYTNGCRCRICADAKAARMRERRAAAYVTDSGPVTDPTVTHGTRFAYEERGCRCETCVTAERSSSRYAYRRTSEAA